MKLFTLPNLITLGNLFCGCLGIVFAFQGDLVWSAYLVGIAAVLDFLDGFVARMMNSHSPIGKELDSLADMVTFGLLPGIIMYHLVDYASYAAFTSALAERLQSLPNQFGTLWQDANYNSSYFSFLKYSAFLVPLFSALRLAKFNVDTRQSESFIGVPTPANTILFASFPLILHLKQPLISTGNWQMLSPEDMLRMKSPVEALLGNPWFLLITMLLMCYLLISELPLFALKFKKFGWTGNEIRYTFLALCAVVLAVPPLIGFSFYVGIPLVIVLYVLLSVVNNLLKKKEA